MPKHVNFTSITFVPVLFCKKRKLKEIILINFIHILKRCHLFDFKRQHSAENQDVFGQRNFHFEKSLRKVLFLQYLWVKFFTKSKYFHEREKLDFLLTRVKYCMCSYRPLACRKNPKDNKT